MPPETLHHVLVRGIERTALCDNSDRADFVARLAEQDALTVYACGLLPNHAAAEATRGHTILRPLRRKTARSRCDPYEASQVRRCDSLKLVCELRDVAALGFGGYVPQLRCAAGKVQT